MELTYIAKRAGRLSAILRQDMGMSLGLMNRLKWQGKLLVNGEPRHTDYPVSTGDTVTALLDDPEPEYPAESGDLNILYEDDWLLAADKPAGMLIHPSRATITGTLANRVAAYYRETGQNCAFHPVTRLDRDTFGVVLLAKNSYAHEKMRQILEKGKLKKTYNALVFGSPEESGIIDAPIARKELPSLLREIRQDGKPAVTEYRRIEQFDETALLALHPVTGRTHQLRLHCAYAGFPIVGDPQYGSPESMEFSRKNGYRSQLLQAKCLEFPHPITEKTVIIRSAYEDLRDFGKM